jgi:hypothetical protein
MEKPPRADSASRALRAYSSATFVENSDSATEIFVRVAALYARSWSIRGLATSQSQRVWELEPSKGKRRCFLGTEFSNGDMIILRAAPDADDPLDLRTEF